MNPYFTVQISCAYFWVFLVGQGACGALYASGGSEPTVLKTPSKAKTETIAEGYALQLYKTISLFCMLVYNAEPQTLPDN